MCSGGTFGLPQLMLLQQGAEGFRCGGFLDEIQRSQPHHSLIGFWLDIAGDHEDLVAQPLPLQGLQHAVAIHFRHGQVEKDQIP